MKKSWLLGVGLASILAIVGLVGCSPGNAVLGEIQELNLSSQQAGIWVSGEGKVTVVPDIATLRLGIEAQEVSVATAQSKATEAMDKVMTALTKNGVAEKDIQVQQFSIRQVTKWDRVKEEEIVTGYRVTHMVTAKIRNIDKTGTIIDAVAEAGGDLTRINSVSLSVDDPSAYHGEAREKAMAEAKAKAKQLAGLAGVTLGKPTYISESTYTPGPIYRQDMIEKAAGAPAVETPISPGEVEITLTIQVAYAILK
ncbi:SIMPL domain-containing protein [Chloroflexota bacterium]